MIATGSVSERRRTAVLAGALAIVGAAFATVGLFWVVGTFGLSTATAAPLWNAFEVGGWALAIALAVYSGGVSAAIYAAIRHFVATLGKKAARKAFIA